MEPHVQIYPFHHALSPDQQPLTPAQQAEAERFTEERIRAQLATEPVGELETARDVWEAERLLREAYMAAGLPPPQEIAWLDGPLQLIAVLVPFSLGHSWPPALAEEVLPDGSVQDRLQESIRATVGEGVWESVPERVRASVRARMLETSPMIRTWSSVKDQLWRVERSLHASMWTIALYRAGVLVEERVHAAVWDRVGDLVRNSLWASLQDNLQTGTGRNVGPAAYSGLGLKMVDGVRAYGAASWLAVAHFYDDYLARNKLHALAHLNTLVSG